MRILVADDHTVVRQGVERILQDGLDDVHLGEARSVEEVLALLKAHVWDLLILDINMQGRSGLEVLREVKGLTNRPHVLVLSMHPEDQLAQSVLDAGASGYLTKDSAPENLLIAIQQIMNGDKYVSLSAMEE